MKTQSISVTEAARNFAECVNRTRYQDTIFVLLKNGKAVARIIPETHKVKKGKELAPALRDALQDAHLTPNEAKAWLHDLEESRLGERPPVAKWQS
jgi:antitoxin (DNA-binding transcriptional repressor) of toxin-antitoxin stability system